MDFEPDGIHNNGRSYFTMHEKLVFDEKGVGVLSYHFTLNDSTWDYSTWDYSTWDLYSNWFTIVHVSAATANVFD